MTALSKKEEAQFGGSSPDPLWANTPCYDQVMQNPYGINPQEIEQRFLSIAKMDTTQFKNNLNIMKKTTFKDEWKVLQKEFKANYESLQSQYPKRKLPPFQTWWNQRLKDDEFVANTIQPQFADVIADFAYQHAVSSKVQNDAMQQGSQIFLDHLAEFEKMIMKNLPWGSSSVVKAAKIAPGYTTQRNLYIEELRECFAESYYKAKGDTDATVDLMFKKLLAKKPEVYDVGTWGWSWRRYKDVIPKTAKDMKTYLKSLSHAHMEYYDEYYDDNWYKSQDFYLDSLPQASLLNGLTPNLRSMRNNDLIQYGYDPTMIIFAVLLIVLFSIIMCVLSAFCGFIGAYLIQQRKSSKSPIYELVDDSQV